MSWQVRRAEHVGNSSSCLFLFFKVGGLYVLVGDPGISHPYIQYKEHAANCRQSVFPPGLAWLLG